jgi:pimeloyl-ACP methyl ester carboxylesterase
MPVRRHLHLDGLRLSYLEEGSEVQGSPSIILIHGLMGCAATYLPLMKELDFGQHVIALDLPGSGLSERRKSLCADLKSTTEIVADAITALGLQRPVVVGHSHGGTVALRLAATHPDLVSSLTLLSPAHPYFQEANALIRFYLTLPGRLFAYTMPWYPQWLQMIALRRMAGPQSWDTSERLHPYRANLRTPGTMSHLLKLIRTWHDDMANLARLLFKKLSTPTLVLWGDCDRAVPVCTAARLRAQLKHSEFHVLGGVGHRPAEEAPAIVADYIHRLIRNGIPTGVEELQPSFGYSPNSAPSQSVIAARITSNFGSGD